MLNRVVLIGRLTRDPELRYTPNGIAVSTFTLALDRNYSKQQGERETDFINIVSWRGLAENVANYLKKGRLAAVDGRIQTRNYENNEGRKVYVTEVVADNVRFLESANSQSRSESYKPRDNGNDRKEQDPFTDDGSPVDISDDDLPF